MNSSINFANMNNNIFDKLNCTVAESTPDSVAPTTLTLDVECKTDSPLVIFEVGGLKVLEELQDVGVLHCWCCLCVVRQHSFS